LPWRDFITDGRLQKVVEIALTNNRDLRLAVLNVEKAEALYGIQRASLLPSVNATGSVYRERIPADLSSSGTDMISRKNSVAAGVSAWELDFFGRLQRLKDEAWEQYLATDQDRRSARIMLVSAVANAYFALAADRENLKLTAATLEAQETTYNLVRKRHDVGLVSALTLRQAQSQVEAARGSVARYTQLVAQDENALHLLAGSPLPPELLPESLTRIAPPAEITSGLTSDPLLKRPDVLAAEHRLKAAHADIGAARAAFFPRISLSTTIGTASAELSGLFRAGSSPGRAPSATLWPGKWRWPSMRRPFRRRSGKPPTPLPCGAPWSSRSRRSRRWSRRSRRPSASPMPGTKRESTAI
jgi:multidrug efflux system outer membrane protein